MNDRNEQTAGPVTPRSDRPRRRKPYTSPHLEVLGDVRDVTLGGTPGINDSGFPNTQPPI